jgi:zinc protease
MRLARLPLLLTIGVIPFLAQADAVPRAKMVPQYKEYNVTARDFNFPSGLRIVFEEDHSQPIVSVTSVIDRGSTSDPAGLEGIAHVCEHIWFRSHQKDAEGKPLPKVWDILREMGANLNAYTADDQTDYMTVVPSDKLVPLLRLESLRLRSAWEGVTNEVLLTEREVVRNELRMRYENQVGAAFGYIGVKLFPPNHPYGRAAYAGIGSHDSLNAITLPDVKKFYQDNYHPENATIVVVGDFKLEDAPKLLDEFSLDQLVDPAHPKDELKLVEPKVRIPPGPSPEPPDPPAPVEVKGEITGLTTEHGAVDKPLIVLGWSLPGGYRDNEPMMEIAAIQLQLAIRQELQPSWDYKNDRKEFTDIGCGVNPQKDGSTAFCFIEISDEKKAAQITEKALDGLYRVWSGDEYYRAFQEYLFSYAKTQQMASVFQSVDLVSSLSGRSTDTANFVHYTGDLRYYSRQFEWINKITADQARKLAEKYLNRNRAVALLMLPYEEGDLAQDTSDAQYRGARREDVLDTVLTEDMLTNDFIEKAVIPPDVSKIKEATLPSGVHVLTMPHSTAPLVQVELSFGGGSDSVEPGVGPFAANMWKNESVVDALRIVGFDGFSMGRLTSDLSIEASAGNLTDALYVLRDRIDNLKPYTDGRIDWIKAQKDAILTWMKDPAEWERRISMERLIPNHPLSKWYNHGDYDTMSKWGANVTGDVFSRMLRPANATLLIVGNVTQEEAKSAADTYFGSWAGWGKPPADDKKLKLEYDPATDPPARTVLLFNKDNSSQTSVSYACQLDKVDDKNVAAAQILGDALSEDTWLALREQTGASYGAYAGTSFYRGGVAFLRMQSLVQNDSAALAVKVFLELGEKAKAGKISTKTLAVVKYNRAEGYVQGHQSTAQMMERLASTLAYGWGMDFFTTYAHKLASVTVADTVPLMDRCVGHEVVTAVGPVANIKPLFDKAGIPVEVFDWKQAKLDYAKKYDLKDVLKAAEKEEKDKAKKDK